MDSLINFFLTYFNPTYIFNLLWDLCIDFLYMCMQFLIDVGAGLLSLVNWICPVFPDLHPPWLVLTWLKHMAWIIPWHYATQMLIVMVGCTMFAIMTTWVLRWLKVVR